MQLGFERHQKYLLVATKIGEDGTTIDAKIQATTIFLFALINLQTTKENNGASMHFEKFIDNKAKTSKSNGALMHLIVWQQQNKNNKV